MRMVMSRADGIFHILIVGGGIAGLTATIALRAPNRSITVLEQSRMNKEVGALIALQPNASKIVTGWGLDPFLAPSGPVIDNAFHILNSAGELQNIVLPSTKNYGASRIIYHRQDLHDALRRAATSTKFRGTPANIRVSSRVVRCNCEEGIVETESGVRFQADLVVGADGIHSIVRNEVVGATKAYAQPTGLSVYRLLFTPQQISGIQNLERIVDVKSSVTTMIFGHEKRIVMGPGRNGDLYGVVALVPDKDLGENSANNSWTSPGSVRDLVESFRSFPESVQEMLRRSDPPTLWQLRDIDPLQTWVKGRTILIGDAAHAMLPLQGQGASQSVEDAEALQAFFIDVVGQPSASDVNTRLNEVFQTRYERASLIQNYSRLAARPAVAEGVNKIEFTTTEFMDYNCTYNGAKDWQRRQQHQQERSPAAS